MNGRKVTTTPSPYYEDVVVGDQLPERSRTPAEVQLFRYSAITWNTHRIHFDSAYAATEGYPGTIVHSHLHGAFLASMCTDWLGPDGRLLNLKVTLRKFAIAGDCLACRGYVTAKHDVVDGVGRIEVALEEFNERIKEPSALATAVISLPTRSVKPASGVHEPQVPERIAL
jgi:acyl dehydratase